jgi:hypothetical protein
MKVHLYVARAMTCKHMKERDRRVVAISHNFDNFGPLTAVTVRLGLGDVPKAGQMLSHENNWIYIPWQVSVLQIK